MKKKLEEKLQFKRPRRDLDTANTDIDLGFDIYKREHLISREDFVAVRRNIISENRDDPDVFMGQIGHVGRKIDTNRYLIYFYDEMRQIAEPEYCQSFTILILDVDDLVKLHFYKQDPGNSQKFYTTDLIEKTVREGESTLNEFQSDLDSVIETSKEKNILIEHNLMSSRFDPGNLVTIVYDFVTRQEKENKNRIIYSGQVAMIKEFFPDTNYVCVVFRNRRFTDLLFKDENLEEIKNISKLRKEGEWVVEAQIHKSFLLPLYHTELKATPKGEEQILKLLTREP